MPAKSKAQQRFMGMVHAAQKGEKPASAKVAKVAKRMKKKDAEDYASTKHKDKPEKVKTEYHKFRGKMTYGSSKPKKGDYVKTITGKVGQVNKVKGKIAYVKLSSNSKSFWPSDINKLKPAGKEKGKTLWTEDRDYKDEYKKFQSSTKAKKYRAELNKYNRKKGTYGNGDGKDASHKGGKIAGFEKESTNRGRAEKSRLKKEEVSINVDKLLKNSKIKALMKRLHIKKSQSQDAALKILNYFANNPQALAAIKKVAFESINEGPWPIKGKLGGVSQEAKLLEKAFKSAGVKVYKVKEYGSRGSNYFVDVQAKGGKTTISIEVNQVSNVVFMHGQGRDVKIGELKENPRELIKVLKMLKKQPGFGQSKLAKKESVNEDWWSEKSTYDQAQYIKDHPNSDKAKSSKKARKDTEANRKKLSKRGYGIDSATGKAVKKSKKKEDPKKQNKHRKAVSKGIFPGSPEYKRFMKESVNEGFTKYHIRLTKTPGWYGVWDKNGKQKFEGDRKFVTKHLKKLKTRMGNYQLKSLIDVATKKKGKNIEFDVVESVNEANIIQKIDKLAKANKYGTVDGTRMNGKTAKEIMAVFMHPKMNSYRRQMMGMKSHELADMTIGLLKTLKIKVESANEDHIKFSEKEMEQLHKDGQIEKDGHTIEFSESVNEGKNRYWKAVNRSKRELYFLLTMAKKHGALGKKGSIELSDIVKSLGNLEQYFYKEKTESVNEGFDKYHLGGLGDSKLKNRLERAIKIWGGKVDAVGMDTIKFRLSSSDVMKFPALLKKLDRNKNVWIGDKRKNNVYDRKQNINKLGEAISKEDWAQYPKYARKLKPYMQRLLKVPLKVRVIKHAFANPWIEIRVAKFGKDVIPNDFRLKAAKAIGATSIRDKSNVNYGNIRSNSVSLKHDQWVKLLGNKVKSESVNEGGMGILDKDQTDILHGIVMKNKNKNTKAILSLAIKSGDFKGVDKKELLGYIDGAKQFVKYMTMGRTGNESVDESGILYRAGVKKYGKEGMRKIQQAAGKRKSHAVIGKIKDKYEKKKKESVTNKDCCDNCRHGKECCSNEE